MPRNDPEDTVGQELVETRPYPHEHSCRLVDPGKFEPKSFRRMTREHAGKVYSIIIGKLKGQSKTSEQAYRYKTGTWTAGEASKHCKGHGGSFAAATEGKSEELTAVPGIDWRTIRGYVTEDEIRADFEKRGLKQYGETYQEFLQYAFCQGLVNGNK